MSLVRLCFAIVLIMSRGVCAEEPIFSGVDDFDGSAIRQSAIAFVTVTTTPGIEGADIEVDRDNRNSDAWRSSVGFSAEFVIPETIFNGYWGLAAVAGGLDDRVQLADSSGGLRELNIKRDVLGVRGSLGLSFPVTAHWRIRPSFSALLASLDSEAELLQLNGVSLTPVREADATVVSSIGTVDILYDRWYGDYQLEVTGQYNAIYTDTTSDDNEFLDTWAWSQTAQLRTRLSGPTNWRHKGRPWRWQGYLNYTDYLDLEEQALGYTRTVELGVGLEWQMNAKPLDWFGWKYLGWRAGFIGGDDVRGFNIGMTAR